MSQLGLLTLGVGDAFSARYYSSALAVSEGGSWLLIDCPHPIRKILREAGEAAGRALDVRDISAVVLTHLHADHCSGLEGLAFYCRYALGRRMPLLAHRRVVAHLWDGHLAGGMKFSTQASGVVERRLEDFFAWVPLEEGRVAEQCGFRVRCRLTTHSVPTTALLVEGATASLGYSADTAFDPDLIDWLCGADLVVHEAGKGQTHTPYERLLELPAAVRGRLHLIHYPDDFDTGASEIEVLHQGRFYPVVPHP